MPSIISLRHRDHPRPQKWYNDEDEAATQQHNPFSPIEDEKIPYPRPTDSIPPWEQHHTSKVPYQEPNSHRNNDSQRLKPPTTTKTNPPPSNPIPPTRSLPYETPLNIPKVPFCTSLPHHHLSPPPAPRIAPPPLPLIGLAGTMTHGEDTYRRRHPQIQSEVLPPSQALIEADFRGGGNGRRRLSPAAWARRLKGVLKEVFHRDPVDEESFERIEGRHWSEE